MTIHIHRHVPTEETENIGIKKTKDNEVSHSLIFLSVVLRVCVCVVLCVCVRASVCVCVCVQVPPHFPVNFNEEQREVELWSLQIVPGYLEV